MKKIWNYYWKLKGGKQKESGEEHKKARKEENHRN